MLKIIFWTIVIVLFLSFFGISIQNIATSPIGQQNFGFVWQIVLEVWNFFVGIFNAIFAPTVAALNAISHR
jgi:hypothetical protein